MLIGNTFSGRIILPNFVPGPCEGNKLKNDAPLTFTQREKHKKTKRVSEEYLSYFHKVFSGYSTLTELMTLKQSGNSSSDIKEV